MALRAPSGSLSIADGEGWGKNGPGDHYKGRPALGKLKPGLSFIAQHLGSRDPRRPTRGQVRA